MLGLPGFVRSVQRFPVACKSGDAGRAGSFMAAAGRVRGERGPCRGVLKMVMMSTEGQPLRSFLFAPGNHPRRVEKAPTLDADAVILDLEDAVATAEKPATRAAVAAALERARRGLLYVRVNAADTEFCYGDLGAVVGTGLDGI